MVIAWNTLFVVDCMFIYQLIQKINLILKLHHLLFRTAPCQCLIVVTKVLIKIILIV